MRRLVLGSLAPVVFTALTACGANSDPETSGADALHPDAASSSSSLSSSSSSSSSSSQGAPVSTPPPNAEQQEPAFEAQTRAPEVDSGVEPKVEEIATDLSNPWAIEFLPSGDLLLTERSGNLRVVTQAGEVSDPIKGVPEVDTRGQGGLLDVALAPDFSTSRWVYLSYAETREDDKTGTAVARGRLSEDQSELTDVEVVFQQMPSWDSTLHYGSRLIWDRDGNLFVSLGERSKEEPRQLAQDLSAHLGKVVRIKPDGSIPEGNPFVDDDQALDEIWSYGHRNIQAATLHPETGELWIIEHGPKGGDEFNIPEAGKNYGWPVITYGEEYSGNPVGEDETKREGMEQPIYYWDPVIAPSGMTIYEGEMFPEWQGDVLVGSMNPGALVRLEYKDKRVTGEERLLTDVGRVRDVVEGPDGAVWIVTDHSDGRLLKVTK